MPNRNLKTFVGSKDYEKSKAFYMALGFSVNWDQADLAELELDGCQFYLQRYYNEQWCSNTMLHLTVDDADEWYRRATAVLADQNFGVAKVTKPKKEDYGVLVTHIWDPSGVLWHMAQPV